MISCKKLLVTSLLLATSIVFLTPLLAMNRKIFLESSKSWSSKDKELIADEWRKELIQLHESVKNGQNLDFVIQRVNEFCENKYICESEFTQVKQGILDLVQELINQKLVIKNEKFDAFIKSVKANLCKNSKTILKERVQKLKAKNITIEENTVLLNMDNNLVDKQDERANQCDYCHLPYTQEKPIQDEYLFQCDKHRFHNACIQAYLQGPEPYYRCPLCRVFLKNSSPLNFFVAALEEQNAQAAIGMINDNDFDINAGNPTDYNQTPLFYAVEHGYYDVVQTLLNVPKIDVNKPNDNGDTPLIIAIYKKNLNILQALLDHPEIDINKQDNSGNSPLFVAVNEQKLEIVQALLKKPMVDVNIPGENGNTPLIDAILYAIQSETIEDEAFEIVQALLNHNNTDINKRDGHDRTPLNFVREVTKQVKQGKFIPNLNHIERLLLDKGAKE